MKPTTKPSYERGNCRILEVYPKRDITNIVESSHFQKVSNWCKVGHKKCKGSHYEWVKPYRCLEIRRGRQRETTTRFELPEYMGFLPDGAGSTNQAEG
uniref:Amyloidogenic glycoprotein heparin-binding domain-containing protein n=1 Tax=Timema monikensis TaxID=170555 RepID=A0A7R9EBC0_9NEOP|nr:unnamed protein product [Timema monikensis]